ncbi:sporulation-specific diadenylate cyclase CdaS [Paenibacillus aurantius]|uniref:Diadenylate cyclase n=1 Tax=Paenibacillus aurantius TaxID=2918900 RepID=A0AA96LEA8_9BACL|nr:sporulation-specific diadenylate cyclase CdaS [Paenibacillus aurantius]WNQ12126.1 sporulation-specific diadenylate cyclase CdaS [Paenibacillus aurantius]
MTETSPCDFSPLKEALRSSLQEILQDLKTHAASLDNEHCCMLSELADIRERFIRLQSQASSFYLNCYLAPYTEKYEELSFCIRHLMERRHGALIIIERKDSVNSLIHQGVPLGARFTFSLLESIFYVGNPLHDGAVLVRGSEIVSAANILPLSNYEAGPKKLGTRHRAAIGLTELCDALVIVVSEETGSSSFAMGGRLYPFMPLSENEPVH